MPKPYRRRNYFTKKGFQSRFTLRFAAASILANAVTGVVFALLAKKKIDGLLFSMRLPNVAAGALLSTEVFFAGMTAVISVSILFLWAARGMYDKISGPLHRIRSDFHTIAGGNLSCRVSLRDVDEFKDFAGEINSMTEALSGRFSELRRRADELAKASRDLKYPPNAAAARDVIRAARASLSALDDRIQAFKI